MDDKTLIEEAKKIIANNIYMTLATASPDGKPWVSPLFFIYDKNYNFFWISNKEARHSHYVRDNKRVAITIFDSHAPEGDGDGVYVEAEAKELSEQNEIKECISLWNKRVTQTPFKIKNIREVTKGGILRIYKATPMEISKLTEGEYINGQYIDKRFILNDFK